MSLGSVAVVARVAQLCPGFSGHARGERWLGCCLSTTAPTGSALLPVTASCSTTSACHYSYFPAAPALLPRRAPPPKGMTSALWNEEWVILEKQLSLDQWQHELGCCIAQFPGAATKCLMLLCPSTGQDPEPAQEIGWVSGGLAELVGRG